jgi:hypothetical protein
MKNSIVLSLYANSRGAVIGDLYVGEARTRVLATTHPATIAAAIFAMDESSFVFKSNKAEVEFSFPIQAEDLAKLTFLLESHDQGNFMFGFAKFSRLNFLHPLPFDDQADIHLRVATHHLGEQLVRIAPLSPPPKGFKKELKNRNKYIYFPSA